MTGEKKEEYCIWNFWIGRMDSSIDWGYLHDLGNRNIHMFRDRKFSIIPVSAVGKGNYRTSKQLKEDYDKMYYEAMAESKRVRKKYKIP